MRKTRIKKIEDFIAENKELIQNLNKNFRNTKKGAQANKHFSKSFFMHRKKSIEQ